ncbi:MAG TPA: aminotransferase class V-fold PLP-dependent enzyme [Acidimicrobiales bacterium]|nr:aminotransferase class V-fold PLP-dependent enzyme [Acidimicrobiales bacterium]
MADHDTTGPAPGASPFDAPLEVAARWAADWVRSLPDRPVAARAGVADLRAALDVPLTDEGADPADVVRELADAAEPGLVATGSPRYFGFVIGGALPAALAADWLAAAWDQNAGLHVGGPSVAVVEEVAGRWVLDLLGLPAGASFGFVTGCQMAHVTALAAARNDMLARAGWDVERQGLVGAPPVRVLAGEVRHATLDRALRLLGLGTDAVEAVACDPDGRMRLDDLAERLGRSGPASPTIVCAQVGEVNTGAIDPVAEICDLAHEHGAWVHVDGAFGLWAAASPALRPLVAGVERADSWATDFHKWLNVPYDSGFAACAHPASHRAAMGTRAAYLVHAEANGPRDQMDWNPEFSRRARGLAVYAALRSLGRRGVADLVERCCALARRAAGALARLDGVEVLNDVVLDQVLVGFRDVDAGRVVEEVQRSGECWMSGTTWQGRPAMRISVINWQTGEGDVDRAVAAIEAAVVSLTRVSPNRSAP